MICSNCNHEFEGKFCELCGAEAAESQAQPMNNTKMNTPRICPRCTNAVSQRYCSICGFDMDFITNNNVNYNLNNQNPYFVAGQQYANNPYAMPKTKKRSPAQIWRIVLVIIASLAFTAAFVIIGVNLVNSSSKGKDNENVSSYNSSNNSTYFMPNGVSISEYNKLKNGMSYAQVSAIIGGDALDIKTETKPQGDVQHTYIWAGENNQKARVYVVFSNDEVVEIIEEGLFN